jgi:hypothetical protein
MAVSCPNCKIPCTGCAGARIATASDGKTVCTKCIGNYEQSLKIKKNLSSNAPAAIQVKYNPGNS